MRDFRELPSVGTIGDQLRLARSDRLSGLRRIAEGPHGMLRFSPAFGSVAIVCTPELAHEVLVARVKAFEKSPVLRGALHPLAGEGLFTSEGELWRRQRKLMAPLFQQHAMAAFAPAMVEVASRVVSTWTDRATIDAAHETTRIAMSVASKAFLDLDTFAEADSLGKGLTTVLEWVGESTTRPSVVAQARLAVLFAKMADAAPRSIHPPLKKLAHQAMIPIRWPGKRTRSLESALAMLDGRVAEWIAERRGALGDRKDLLTLLVRAKDDDLGTTMSDKQVRDEIVTLFVAGHETTANALAWSLMLLAQHRDWYEKAVAEARAPREQDDVAALPILSRVFKEALRLYPPLYVFGRVAIADTTLGDYRIKRGTVVLVSPYAIHRRAETWPDPERFDPDRFLPAAESSRSKTAFLPFGAGPRVCIGGSFALLEGPLVLATLLSRADFELVDARGADPEPVATIRPRGGLPMRVTLRTHHPHG